jgi:hypothetical protein
VSSLPRRIAGKGTWSSSGRVSRIGILGSPGNLTRALRPRHPKLG